jgi:hypothetical protein
MLMQRWTGPILICFALAGCCTDGTMCMAPPTSGPAMAWDGAGGQPPDQDIQRTARPRHPKTEIQSSELPAIQPDRSAEVGVATGVANGPAAEPADEAASAEAQLKNKLVICRGCLTKPAAVPDRQATASANP